MALLEVTDLRTHFFTREGVVHAVDGVSFAVERGQTLGIVVQQVQATVQAIQDDPDMPANIKVTMLSSLADAYNKLVSASRRLMPETDKLAVATDVVKRLADFTRTKHPKHASALIEVLEPFADELAKAYGQ